MRRSYGRTRVCLPGVRLQVHSSMDLMIFVGKSTRYPDVDPWFISTIGSRFPDTYRKAARKALRRLRVIYRHHLQRTPMGFFPPTEGRGRIWITRMRGHGREEEDLEDTVSPIHLPH